MKKTKQILSVFLALILVVSIIPMSIITASAESNVASGMCGDNLTWFFDDSTDALTIFGTGAMNDYSSSNRPWETYEDSIKTILIADGATTIGEYAFYNCDSLIDVIIPDNVTIIGDYAFYYCTGLTSITIPDSVITIGDATFCYCTSLASAIIGDGVTTIGVATFGACASLESVILPNNIVKISDGAFAECLNLKTFNVPANVTEIGESAFYLCSKLKEITIPNSLKNIMEDAFLDCYSLTKIIYSGTEENWNNIQINDGNEQFINARNSCIYEGDLFGKCGENVSWEFDKSTGKLHISGTGPMDL